MKNALPRIWRSPYTDFGHDGPDTHDETVTANAVYTDEVLADIAANGFSAIWVHGLLHHMVPSSVFPEFGANSSLHMDNMRALIERAARHGLRIFIYMQPPRGFDSRDDFWRAHPEVKGAPAPWQTLDNEATTYIAMCTSTPQVKEFLSDSSQTLGRELPNLGGVIMITASEYPSHCYARHNMMGAAAEAAITEPLPCPRCVERAPADVVSEILRLVSTGLREHNPDAQVVAWNWSWTFYEADPSPSVIAALPEDVILMLDFERGDTKVILGKERMMDEYSLSFAGPSQRFLRTREIALKRGLPIMTKLQLGTTHELGTVPNLPLIGNLHEKATQMRNLDVRGFMGSWNFGNMNSANSAGFNEFFNAETLLPRDEALRAFAEKYFGPDCKPELARQAWETFADAMNSFPFSIPFIYNGPMNYTLSYQQQPGPLEGVSAGRSWVADPRGDDLSECLAGVYTVDEAIEGMELVARKWQVGAELLTEALEDAITETAKRETANAWVCYHVWRSSANTLKVYKLRLDWSDNKLSEYRAIIADELENVKAALPYVEADDRFGFHSEAHAYLYDAATMKQKIEGLEKQLAG